ncbi:MAG TPA: hypothetical protein PKZ76_18205 [Xanthomonadaceae bacterium]|nr:hypothetical protein [Xanthomonadaceae bacterium]
MNDQDWAIARVGAHGRRAFSTLVLGCLMLLHGDRLHAEFVPVFDVVQRAGSNSISDLRLVRAADGRATVVWLHADRVERRVININGSMGSVAQLPTLGFGSARDPAVTVDLQGRVLVAWEEGGRIVAHRLAANGALTTTFLLSSGNASNARNPRVAVDATGVGAVAWERGSRVEAVRLAVANAAPLSTARLLTDAKEDSPPDIVAGGSGDATVVWRRAGRIEYRRLQSDGSIGGAALSFDTSPCIIDLPRFGSHHPLAVGRPWIIARGRSASGCPGGDAIRSVQAADSPQFPVVASPNSGLLDDPDHAVHQDAGSRRWMVWRQDLNLLGHQRMVVQRANLSLQAVSPDGVGVAQARLAVAENQSAMAVWREILAGSPVVRGRRVGFTGDLGPVQTFSTAGGQSFRPAVAMQPHDRPAIAWLRMFASQEHTLVQATLDVAPPACTTPIARTILPGGAATVTPESVCQGWLDGPPAVVEFTQLPEVGHVEVFLGTIIYVADGSDYHENFRFRVSGPGGQSNEVAVNIEVLDGSFIFLDGFESD